MNHLKKLLFLLLLFVANTAYAVSDSVIRFKIFIADTSYNPVITAGSPYVTVTFSDGSLNTIVSGYNVTSFQRTYISRHPYLQQFWTITVNSASLMSDLINYDSTIFQGGVILSLPQLLWTTTPNDFGYAWSGNQGDLDLINVHTAWGITHGSPSTILGYTDEWVDMGNPDITGKFYKIGANDSPGSTNWNHGVAVGGMLAASTDNGQLTSAICADCKLDFSSALYGIDTVGHMSMVDNVRVINLSWYSACSASAPIPFADDQMYIDEIFENGTTICSAAGNGLSDGCGSITHYDYPSSYNHVVSVGGVGWDQSSGASINIADYIEESPGSTASACTVNDRINIYAPAFGVHVITSSTHTGGLWYETATGTSLSSPMVAGTIGLMLTVNNGLSPYQVVHILDATANKSMYYIAANSPFSGKMGYGRLDAGVAVDSALPANFNDNSPSTQTMTIDGVEINTICAPGVISGLAPHLKAIVRNGTPPYTYEWDRLFLDHTSLTSYTTDTTTINGSSSGSGGPYLANYYLTVKDNSSPPQLAGRQIRIQLDTNRTHWDLASRDTYLDMLDEPNSQATVDPIEWGVWNGPDLWNRKHKDDVTVNQNPEYFIDSPNYVYTRIRNVGCAATTGQDTLRLYWTKQSTGEHWPADWINTSTFGGHQAGDEITSASPIIFGVLQPGTDTIISHPWYPPQPELWGASLHSVDACLLARILDKHNISDPAGMTYNEVSYVKPNFLKNNNIVTRNLTVNDSFPGNQGLHLMVVGNPDAALGHVFNFTLSTDKVTHKHFAGDISALISSIKVTFLSSTVFSNWESNGSVGNYASIDEGDYSVTFSPVCDLMHLDSISLDANAKEGLIIEINIDSAALTSTNAPQYLYFDQYQPYAIGTEYYQTGEVVYKMCITSHGLAKRSPAKIPMQTITASMFGLYPNPTTGICTLIAGNFKDMAGITVTDVLGKTVLQTTHDFGVSRKTDLNLSQVPAGIYMVRIQGNGISDIIKVAKE